MFKKRSGSLAANLTAIMFTCLSLTVSVCCLVLSNQHITVFLELFFVVRNSCLLLNVSRWEGTRTVKLWAEQVNNEQKLNVKPCRAHGLQIHLIILLILSNRLLLSHRHTVFILSSHIYFKNIDYICFKGALCNILLAVSKQKTELIQKQQFAGANMTFRCT